MSQIVIAKSGEPCARLVPLETRPPRRAPGTLKRLVVVRKAFFDPLPAGWSGSD